MKVYVVTTNLQPFSEDSCPIYIFKKNPSTADIVKELEQWDVVIKNGGMKQWIDDDIWSYDISLMNIINNT